MRTDEVNGQQCMNRHPLDYEASQSGEREITHEPENKVRVGVARVVDRRESRTRPAVVHCQASTCGCHKRQWLGDDEYSVEFS